MVRVVRPFGELRTIPAGAQSFVRYIQREPDRPTDNNPNPLTDSPNWGAFYLIKDGAEVAENSTRCPRTLAAMAQVRLCRINGRTPSVLFSLDVTRVPKMGRAPPIVRT